MIINFLLLLITVIFILVKKNRWAVLFFMLTILAMKLDFMHHATDSLMLQF